MAVPATTKPRAQKWAYQIMNPPYAPNTASGIWQSEPEFARTLGHRWCEHYIEPKGRVVFAQPSAASAIEVDQLTDLFREYVHGLETLAGPYALISGEDMFAYRSAPLGIVETVMVHPHWVGDLQPSALPDDD